MSTPCLTDKEALDLSCSCKKSNSCYKAMSKVEQKIFKAKVKSKTDKQIFNFASEGYKLSSKILSREIDLDGIEMKKFEKQGLKLSKVTDKSIKWYEKFLKSKGAKQWKIKDRAAAINKAYLNTVPKDTKDKLDQGSFFQRMSNFLKSKLTGTQVETDFKSNVIASNNDIESEVNEEITPSEFVEKANSDPTTRNNSLVEAKANQMRRKNFKFDTIIKNKNVSIFKIISRRYYNVASRDLLSINATAADSRVQLSEKDKKRILSGFSELINKL